MPLNPGETGASTEEDQRFESHSAPGILLPGPAAGPGRSLSTVDGETTREACRRFRSSPLFHRIVETAVQTMEAEHGIRFDDHDRSLATEAAAVALLIAERPLASLPH